MELRSQLEASLKSAVKARDQPAMAALRSALAAIDNAGAVAAPRAWPPTLGVGAGEADRRGLSTDEVLAIVRDEIAERVSAAHEFDSLGRPDQAARLRAEAAALQAHFT